MNNTVLSCQQLHKSFHDGEQDIHVLQGINLVVAKQQSIAITGASGCGKTTLLQILGGLDNPSIGDVYIDNQKLSSLNEKQLSHLRNHKLGFIYQFHHLLPEFTAIENTAMPLFIRGEKPQHALAKAKAILTKVNLDQRLSHKPAQLSGGERQRVAIARALVTEPLCVLADEPTGNLDQHTAEEVLQLMFKLQHQVNTSFIVVTHDMTLAKQLDKKYELVDGRLVI